MTLFSSTFFALLVHLAIVMTAAGGATLLILLWRDWRRGSLW
jgi:hypothetical protein